MGTKSHRCYPSVKSIPRSLITTKVNAVVRNLSILLQLIIVKSQIGIYQSSVYPQYDPHVRDTTIE